MKSISVDVPFTYRLVCSRNRFVVTVPLPCSDINECAATFTGRRCSPQATCNNSLGSYSCRCNDGFSGDGFTCSGKIFVDFRLDECIRVEEQSLDRRLGYDRDAGGVDKCDMGVFGSSSMTCVRARFRFGDYV
jgi:hypothetical protein